MNDNAEIQIGVLIVNYRTPQLTIDCLRSLAPEVATVAPTVVVVVDNGSGDGSAELIRSEIESQNWHWARLVDAARNLGFAGGNNLAWQHVTRCRYVLLLNSDTVVNPGCLRHCHMAMEADATIGAMSCLVLNADGTVQNVTRRFPTPLNQLACRLGLPWRWPRLFGGADTEDPTWDRRTVKRDVGWIGGAFMFLRGDMVRRIGLLDESFFFYGEDIEFCHRIWRSGYRVHFDPASSIVHYGGASSDPTRLASETQNAHRREARYLVQRKCHGRTAAWLMRASDLGVCTLRLLARSCSGRSVTPERREIRQLLSVPRRRAVR